MQLSDDEMKKLMQKQIKWSNNNLSEGHIPEASWHAGCATAYALICGERVSKFGLIYGVDYENQEVF